MSRARRSGKRYPLLLYTRMIDRWWPAVFFIGLGMVGLAWPFYSDLYTRLTEPWRWMTMAGVGGAVIVASLVMLALRRSAYVQPLRDHLILATPFLRMSVSYKRIRRSSTAAMSSLFPPRRLPWLKREILEPLFGHTAVVLDLSALPMPRSVLGLFLSPFFFKPGAPGLVILVDEWIVFSTELDSMRTSLAAEQAGVTPSVFSGLSRK